MKKDDRITVFLSPGELFWIASNLGIKNLLFLSTFFRGQPPEEVRAIIQQGFETLLMRNLVHRHGSKSVEVDPSLISLVGMVATPEYADVIGSIRNGEAPIQAYLYFKSGQSISVVYKDRFFHFALYREEAALQRSLLNWLGISGQISERAAQVKLKTVDFGDLLPKIWAKPESAVDLMGSLDLSDAEANRQAEFLGAINLFSQLTRIGLQEGRLAKQSQVIMLGNAANLWVTENGDTLPETLTLQPVIASRAAHMAIRYLRTDVSIDKPEEDLIE
jgi:hypothetical protein